MIEADFPAAHSMDSSWFAVDRDGHVGYFYTGADGAMPHAASPGPSAYDGMLDMEDLPEDLRDEFAARPDVLAELARLIPASKPKRDLADPGTAPEEARHGLFVYSCHQEGLAAPYTREWLPGTPLHIDQLPPELRRAVNGLQFKFSFLEARSLQPFEHGECSTWGPAWLSADGKKICPVPGEEKEFAKLAEELRAWYPEAVIELPPPKPKKPNKTRKRKPNK
ncbi:MAG: hypothetical protein AB7K24_21545 [Gemmataceae bacterium]